MSMKNSGSHKVSKLNNLSAMKTLKFLIAICIFIGFSSFSASAQKEKIVNEFSYPFQETGMIEAVLGNFIQEIVFSENKIETTVEGTGIGEYSGLTYTISSNYDYKFHGKNNEEKTYNQILLVRCEGKLVFRVIKVIQFKLDESGELTANIVQYKVDIMY